jgi:hypothetical protein
MLDRGRRCFQGWLERRRGRHRTTCRAAFPQGHGAVVGGTGRRVGVRLGGMVCHTKGLGQSGHVVCQEDTPHGGSSLGRDAPLSQHHIASE